MEGDRRNAAAGGADPSASATDRSGLDRSPKRRKKIASAADEESQRREIPQILANPSQAARDLVIRAPRNVPMASQNLQSLNSGASPKLQQQFNPSLPNSLMPAQSLFGFPLQGSLLGIPFSGGLLNYPGWLLGSGLQGAAGGVLPNVDSRLSLQQQLLASSMSNPVLSHAIGLHLRNSAGAAFGGNASAAALVTAASQGSGGAAATTNLAAAMPSPEDIEAANEPDLTGRPPSSLYMACDDDALSEYQCLVRKQIELFEARREDVDSNAQGRNRPIVMGQVGIRCRHCTMLPPKHRARGAVYYPAKLYGLYQAAQNMASGHLCDHCQHMQESLRSELVKLRERKSAAGGGKKYWADGVRILGVFEDENGLRFERR